MARSRSISTRKRGRLFYVIPLIAVLGVGSAFALAYVLPPPGEAVQDFEVAISISVANGQNRTFITPPAVGVAGGRWLNHKYDINGVSGRYPLYTLESPPGDYPGFTFIHVESRVVHNYTLGDFFDVWGQPLGESNTLGIQSNSYNVWQMCIGQQPNRLGNWRSEVLTSGLFIYLVYYSTEASIGCL